MRRVAGVLRAAAIRFSQDGCGFFAQAIAFNALFATFPVLILIFAVMGYIYGNNGQAIVTSLIGELAPSVQGLLLENVHHIIEFRGISGALAIVALLWSGKNLFGTLSYSLDRSLGIPKGRHPLIEILIASVTLPAITAGLLAATSVPGIIAFIAHLGRLQHAQLWTQLAGYAAGLLLVFAVTMGLYTFLPNRRFSLRFGIPGAIVTTILWEVSQIAFTIYSSHVDFRHIYGALAAVAILLLWFYYMGAIFLFGAQVSAQWLATSKPELRSAAGAPSQVTA
jgi:membrane protein